MCGLPTFCENGLVDLVLSVIGTERCICSELYLLKSLRSIYQSLNHLQNLQDPRRIANERSEPKLNRELHQREKRINRNEEGYYIWD